MNKLLVIAAVLVAGLVLNAVPAEAAGFCTRLYGKNQSATKVNATIIRIDGSVQKKTNWNPGNREHFKFCWNDCSKKQSIRKFVIEELQNNKEIASGQISWKVNESGHCKVSHYVDQFNDVAGDNFTVSLDTIKPFNDDHNSDYLIIYIK